MVAVARIMIMRNGNIFATEGWEAMRNGITHGKTALRAGAVDERDWRISGSGGKRGICCKNMVEGRRRGAGRKSFSGRKMDAYSSGVRFTVVSREVHQGPAEGQ